MQSSCFFFSSRRRHTRWPRDWSSDVCSSDLDCSDSPGSAIGSSPPNRRAGAGLTTQSSVCGCHGRTATSNHCVHSPGNCTVTATAQFLDPTFRIGLTARIVSAPILVDGCVPVGSISSAPTATSLQPYRSPEEKPIGRCCVQRCTLIESSAERPIDGPQGTAEGPADFTTGWNPR